MLLFPKNKILCKLYAVSLSVVKVMQMLQYELNIKLIRDMILKRYLHKLNTYVLRKEINIVLWYINIFSFLCSLYECLYVGAWQKQFKNQCIWINIMKGHKRKERFIVKIQKRNQFFKENPSQSENKFPLLLLFYDTPIV